MSYYKFQKSLQCSYLFFICWVLFPLKYPVVPFSNLDISVFVDGVKDSVDTHMSMSDE